MESKSDVWTVAVVMAVHNRLSATEKCIASLLNQVGRGTEFDTQLVICDDGSTDGTSEYLEGLRELGERITIIRGEGNWYWAKSMAMAEIEARKSDLDFILWLNDDVILTTDALRRALATEKSADGATVVVGAFFDPQTGLTSYGGRIRSGRSPLALSLAGVFPEPISVDAFHGNLVLLPKTVIENVGAIDGDFQHAFADDDYSLRCSRAGVPILQAPGYLGECEGRKAIRPKGFAQRISYLRDPKSLPIQSLYRFLIRHRPLTWPYYLAKTVFRTLVVPSRYWR